jgi:hypothetical protein
MADSGSTDRQDEPATPVADPKPADPEAGSSPVAGEPERTLANGVLSRVPFFPYLLCYFTVISLLAPNVRLVSPVQVMPALLGILLACLAVHVVLYFVSWRRSAFAALCLFGLLLAFFYEPLIRQIGVHLPGSSWRLPLGPLSMSLGKFVGLGICSLLPLAGAGFGWFMRPSGWRRTCLCLNLLMLGLFVSSTVTLGVSWGQTAANTEPPTPFDVQEPRGIAPEQYPDVIHIVLDAYARDDVYRRLTGEESPVTKALAEWDFQRAKYSSSNANTTVPSTFCLMNFQYPALEVSSHGYSALSFPAIREFEHLGYRVTMDHWAGMGTTKGHGLFVGKFYNSFWLSTMWATLRIPLFRYGVLDVASRGNHYRRHFEAAMDTLAHLDPNAKQPVYYQAHVKGTHAPYIYDRDGNHIWVGEFTSEADDEASRQRDLRMGQVHPEEAPKYYAEQAKYCAQLVAQALRKFLAAKRQRPFVIILQSDHGPRVFSFHPQLTPHGTFDRSIDPGLLRDGHFGTLAESFADYTAVLTSPGVQFTLPDDITPINILPLLFNQVFGMSVPLQDNRHFIMGVDGKLVECTDAVAPILVGDSPGK